MVNSKRHYRINPETLQLERIEHGFRYWLRRSGGYILGGFGIGMIFFYVFLYFFPSPREASLMQYNRNLTAEMAVLEKQVDQMQIIVSDLSQRDDNLYRAILVLIVQEHAVTVILAEHSLAGTLISLQLTLGRLSDDAMFVNHLASSAAGTIQVVHWCRKQTRVTHLGIRFPVLLRPARPVATLWSQSHCRQCQH